MKWFRLALITVTVFLAACHHRQTLFEQVSASHSGIDFNNEIIETDTLNPLNVVNIYNGGGVGVGDFNNDGLQDLYLTGNRVSSRLYLNKGNLKFNDVTKDAGVDGLGRWARGVSIVDINNDGLLDIYICNTIYHDSAKRTNILYVNQGIDKSGTPHFKDMAAEYGLDLHPQSTMANFFDCDNDGDLDMYLTVNAANAETQNRFGKSNNNIEYLFENNTGKLFRNDWDSVKNHPIFKDVSREAKINIAGFGHAATVADINQDGWKDIYVSDDFLSDNLLYINNHDGTFTDRSREYFKHTAFNAMGQDIIDVNNDGLPDVIELDMNPKDNYRKKMMLAANNYNSVKNFEVFGNQYQYVRNTLQLNLGPALLENDSIGSPVFSEIGFMSGISQTDWSWTPSVIDFDNDGFRDIIVTNGFPRDVTDHDFIAYRKNNIVGESSIKVVQMIPEVKLANFAFKNTNGLMFSDVTNDWGLTEPGFSNGAVYADLDNDGDMDIVINNIDEKASIYKNMLRERNDTSSHFLQVKCLGPRQNVNAIGATVAVYYDNDKQQVYENTPYRGYLSSNQNIAHFGLGIIATVDSVVVTWAAHKRQVIKNVKADQVLTMNIVHASDVYEQSNSPKPDPLFKEITSKAGISYVNRQTDFNDFNIQTNLLHKLSEYGPALAAGDVDGNGLDDIVIGGNPISPAKVLLQQQDGQFVERRLLPDASQQSWSKMNEGLLLVDVNGDKFLDLYIASGGYKDASNNPNYQDQLFINDGKGNFKTDTAALPENHTSKLCVRAIDYNKDGKMDLFVSGRVNPWNYPKPVSSFIYRNDTKDGKVKFTDVTDEVAPGLKNIGLVCDALFTDFDNDGQTDLLLAGEWMPVTFFKNVNGKFTNVTNATGIDGKKGWWNSIVAGDFRHTGRMDYIVANVGLNTLFQASDEYPVYVTAKDFNGNGSYQAIPSLFLRDKEGELKEFPAHGRDDITDRIPALKKRFDNYNSFAVATLEDVLTEDQRKGALRLEANLLQSCYMRNDGNGKFTLIPLPVMAQVSVLNGMIADDFDGDGNLDVLINGNDYGTDVSIGRYDALSGLLLKGDGNGGFTPLSILQSGVYLPGNGKALVKLAGPNGTYLAASSENRGPVKLFELRKQGKLLLIEPTDAYAIIRYKNGKSEKREFHYGSSFLSQSSRRLFINGDDVTSVTVFDVSGKSRSLSW